MAAVTGERNASFRMVLGCWDMAASLVSSRAIDADSFLAAHTEIIGTFCKIYPFVAEMRSAVGEPGFLKHMEAVVTAAPDAEATLKRRRERLLAMARARKTGQNGGRRRRLRPTMPVVSHYRHMYRGSRRTVRNLDVHLIQTHKSRSEC